jgi:RNA polymerase sigma-70 factor (ECF subfamily)
MALPRLKLVVEPSAPVPAADDAAVAEALMRGEPGAAFAAWKRLRPMVARTLRRLIGPDRDVTDLEQEVFLRFFRQIGKLRSPAAVRGFVAGICLRVVRRELRHRWMRGFLRLTASGEPPEAAAPAAPADLESREVLRRYYAVLERLGAEARSLFVARQIEELPMDEVAALHGLSLSTTQRRLGRAVRRVAAMVEGDPVIAAYLAGREGGER